VALELGGKSPHLVFNDVLNIDMAVDAAVEGMFFNQGEVCDGGSRLLLQRDIHDVFMEKLLAKVARIRIGNPFEDVDMGAIISAEQCATVMEYIEIGKKEAKLACGGHRLTGGIFDQGYYIEPTVFDDVKSEAIIAQKEIFGPVLVVQIFDRSEEAIAIANNSIYGLASGLWTKDIYKAIRVSKSLRTGSVYINDFGLGSPQLPFGGCKQSGIGREKGRLGMEEYTQLKTVHIQTATTKDPWIK
jgi:betaine-aldehyde dehydrogenase